MSLLLSDFYPKADAVLVTGNQNITGVKTFGDRLVTPEIRGVGLGGVIRKIDLNLGQLYSSSIVSLDYFRRILSGNWDFQFRPTVSGIGVLLQGEAAGGGTIANVVYTTGSQTIIGPKNFTARPTFNNQNLITTGDLINLELNLEGLLQSSSEFNGSRAIRQLPVVGTSYGGTTISGFLNNLFFPYTNANISLSNFTSVFNYGYDSISSLTFAGTLNALDDNVTGISVLYSNSVISGPSTPSLGAGNSYSISVNQSSIPNPPIGPPRIVTSDELFRVRATGIRSGVTQFNIISNNNIRYRFEPPYFYGVSPNSNLGVGVTGLNRVNAPTYLNIGGSNYEVNGRPSRLSADGTIGLPFTFNANGYIYIAYPNITSPGSFLNAWGALTTEGGVVDSTSFFDYTSQFLPNASIISINFPTHASTSYRMYRSDLITPITLPATFRLRFQLVTT